MIIDHRYEVLESLGSGAWSNVYKVQDKRSGFIYTLKLFQYLSSAELYEKFSAEEMHHITKIEHPNLGHIMDFGHVGDHIYSLSEYYDGTSLRNFRYRKAQTEILYDVIVQIAYALEALHGQEILHKDLKPENVLFRIDGNKVGVMVIDYGFSKINTNPDHQEITGSLPYAAPEAFQARLLTPASDYYSLGVLLYQITTGSYPFSLAQINALVTGSQYYFIPKFPSELNPDIPPALEKFILRLLEKNPENRFNSAGDVINYINRIQTKQYPFSIEWSLVNRIRYNSYVARENYSHQMLDYVPNIEASNGKIISVIAGEGLGKESILSLFRYHLLYGNYFLFDYRCSKHDHEPFFALIKEFMQSITKDELQKLNNLDNISAKFKLYLFQSASEARKISQNQDELRADFESVRSLLQSLSEHKPIIFIIRNAQFIHKHTVDFINFISSFVTEHRIMIVMGFNEYNKVNLIQHKVLIQIPPFTYQETIDYINKLLNQITPEYFNARIWELAAGNPYFIREILVDLVEKKKITTQSGLRFDFDFLEYKFPLKVVNSIYARLSHINDIHYSYLKMLSVVESPLNRELIAYLLNVKDKELYDFINSSLLNEILSRQQHLYVFTYKVAKQRLKSENPASTHKRISQEVVNFYSDHPVKDIGVCRGIIANAEIAADIIAQRNYTKKLYEMYDEIHDQEMAYKTIIDVLNLDLNPSVKLPQQQLMQDLLLFQSKTEITGHCNCGSGFLNKLKKLPEVFEKYYVLSTIFNLSEDAPQTFKSIQKASRLAITGKQNILIWLSFVQYYAQNDLSNMQYYLDLLAHVDLPLDLRIAYIDRLSLYNKMRGEVISAIKISEDFLQSIPSVQNVPVLLRLASLHNNLGVCYSLLKNIEEAEEHFDIALSIWKRFDTKRYLSLIYNNLADLHLKQGITDIAKTYALMGYELAQQQGLGSTIALALLNMGEAHIKLGKFQLAENYLNQARDILTGLKSERYLEAIKVNLALAKSKIGSFGYYYNFIRENEPELIDGVIKEVNPLIKTYFYYLYALGAHKKLAGLLSKNAQIDYHEIHEDEFYYNTKSLIAILNKDYTLALEHLKNAEKHAGEVKNHYAITVFMVTEIECYIGLNDYAKAYDLIDKAMHLCLKHHYYYWQQKLKYLKAVADLSDPNIPLRAILRQLLEINQEVNLNDYYLIKMKLMLLIVQVLSAMNAESDARQWYEEYNNYLLKITDDIDKEDKQHFLKQNQHQADDLKKINLCSIVTRSQSVKTNWNEMQYSLSSLQSEERILYFIDKGLKEVIAPWNYQIMLYSKEMNTYSVYLQHDKQNEYLLTSEIYQHIERSFKTDTIIAVDSEGCHDLIIPLQIKYHRIGFMILSDKGELKFTKGEIALLRSIKKSIANLIIRIQDYSAITKKMEMMNRLMTITHALLKIIDINALQQEIVSSCVSFTGSSRGFLIKKDAEGNYNYEVAINAKKSPISNIAVISKTVLSECQKTKTAIYTLNAQEDNRFKNSISVHDYKLHTIFCAPLILHDTIFGFVYLDNFLDNSKSMYLDPEIITLLFDQIHIALKNALQYETIIQKSQELQSLEDLKDEFMAIVAHELNTPLSSLQGYVSRMKRSLFSDEEERRDLLNKIEMSVKKLILTTNDIMTMNNYNLKTELPKASININDVLSIIYHETEIVSKHRNMIIKLEVAKNVSDIEGNWEAIHLMIYNLVLNSIRFTNDFGTIVIGARHSAFQEEKINNREALVVYVQDNGIGIPAYQLKNVFRKFYELNEIYAHKSGTTEYRSSGLGLGLATAKRIADLHGGNIWIRSRKNEGTTVFVSLPIKQETKNK